MSQSELEARRAAGVSAGKRGTRAKCTNQISAHKSAAATKPALESSRNTHQANVGFLIFVMIHD